MQMLRIDMEVLDSFVKEHLPDILAKFQLVLIPIPICNLFDYNLVTPNSNW